MSTTRPARKSSEAAGSRCLRMLEIEHDIIRRFARLLREVYAPERAGRTASSVDQLVLEFGERFVEGRHHLREERMFHAVFRGEDPVMDARLYRHEDERDEMRVRLEGMRRALEGDDPGGRTFFAWNALALANRILLHLNREEVEILPLLEVRLDAATDERLGRSLGLDLAEGLSDYAQAENVLLILRSV